MTQCVSTCVPIVSDFSGKWVECQLTDTHNPVSCSYDSYLQADRRVGEDGGRIVPGTAGCNRSVMEKQGCISTLYVGTNRGPHMDFRAYV